MQERTDMELLRQYVHRNSEEAFAALVSRHVNLVYSAALRKTGNAHAAEETTQAVFIILAKKAGGLRAPVILSGWLHQTARLTAANFLRTEIRRARREQEACMSTPDPEPAPEVWPQILPLLDDALGRLGEKDRNALALRFFEQKSFSEIGAACGASENAARKRVDYALEKLRRHFSKHGVSSTTHLIAGALSAHSVQAAPAALAPSVTAAALAKGATAGGSTLTLVKSTLKLMAWTKAKTAVLTGAIVLLATVSTITVIRHSHPSPPRQTGRLKLPTGNVTPMVGYGLSQSVVILAGDGSLWSWGDQSLAWPVLGVVNTNIPNSTVLRRIGHDSDWVSISVSGSDCLAIKAEGSLWAWGQNLRYQLGDGTKITRATPVRSVPGNDWIQAAVGGDCSLAIKKDGTLWAWGDNWSGALGIGGTQNAVQNATQVGNSTNWTKIWAGSIQTVGLQTDGSLWFWGSLTGDSTNDILVPQRVSPDTNWVEACFGYFTIFALKSDGTLWSWGLKANFYTGAPDAGGNDTPRQVGTENDWQSCASSGGFYLLLRKKDGSLWALDASAHRIVKPAASYPPVKLVPINLHKDVATFTAGRDNIGVVLTPDGEVWTWGDVLGENSVKVIDQPWQVTNEE